MYTVRNNMEREAKSGDTSFCTVHHTGRHSCPIHPNWVDSPELLLELARLAWHRVDPHYRKSRFWGWDHKRGRDFTWWGLERIWLNCHFKIILNIRTFLVNITGNLNLWAWYAGDIYSEAPGYGDTRSIKQEARRKLCTVGFWQSIARFVGPRRHRSGFVNSIVCKAGSAMYQSLSLRTLESAGCPH